VICGPRRRCSPGTRQPDSATPTSRTSEPAIVDGTALTSGELDALVINDGNQINQPWGNTWPSGQQNITIAYEAGLDRPPPEVRGAAFRRCRSMAFADGPGDAGMPAQARSANVDGTSVQLDQAAQFKTGDPEVDAIYQRWSVRSNDGALVAVSRSVDLNSQYLSLFHGGQR
jgi:hypothetical protein